MLFRDFRSNRLWRAFNRCATAARPTSSPHPPPLNGQLRYALLGAGSAARAHLTSVLARPGVELVGIFDPAPRSSWRIPKEFHVTPSFADATAMLRQTRPHLVSVCTPPKYHHGLTLLSLREGAHVVCEKPLAMSLGEALDMERARIRARKLGAVNFSYRTFGAFRFARQVVASGELGRLTRVSVVYLQSFMSASSAIWSWRHDVRVAGFGAIGDLGVHMIDGVRYVTGLEFSRVVATARTQVPHKRDRDGVERQVTTDTHAMFLAELDGDALAMFETTQLAPGYGDLFRIEVSGELGTLFVDSEHPNSIWMFAAATPPRHAIWKTDIPIRDIPLAFASADQGDAPGAIVKALRGEPVEFPTFADGVAAQRVLAALAASLKSGTWTEVC